MKPFCINEKCENFLPEDQRGYRKKPGQAAAEAENQTEGETAAAETGEAPAKKTAAKKSTAKKTATAKKTGEKKSTAAKKTTTTKKATATKKTAKKQEEDGEKGETA